MTFTAQIGELQLPLTVAVVPGSTRFLVSRPTLEAWGVVHDYKNGKLKFENSEWFSPERGGKGHYILNLLDYPKANLPQGGVEESFVVDDGEDYGVCDEVKLTRELNLWKILGALSPFWRRKPRIAMIWSFWRLKRRRRRRKLWLKES